MSTRDDAALLAGDGWVRRTTVRRNFVFDPDFPTADLQQIGIFSATCRGETDPLPERFWWHPARKATPRIETFEQ